jgi:16S rRNA (uracil1498-N3)-methyltransferase
MAATRDFVRECGAGMDIAVFIGPEGGFDEAEVEQAKKLGWQPVSLGNRILRTETAGLTMLSILMYQLEE